MRKHMIGALLIAVSLSGCLSIAQPPRTPQPPPPPTEAQLEEWTATCTAIWREELDRPAPYIDPEGLAGCIEQAKAGGTAETIRESVRSSKEYTERLERLERERQEAEEREKLKGKLRGRLKVVGTEFIAADGKRFLFVGASELSILMKTEAERNALLDLLRELGFNGLRVFAGHLGWESLTQTLDRVYDTLPGLLRAAADRGLYVMVTAVTDSGVGYDVLAHVKAIRDETAKHDNILFEIGNELYHGTQSPFVRDIAGLCAKIRPLMEGYPHPWALGAAAEDYPINGHYASDCGTFNTSHVSRGGNETDIVNRLTSLAAIVAATGKPVLNSEPIGAAEVDMPGRRISNPAFFGRLGRRSMSYGFGSVFHSEDGLFARPWGPRQREAAQAFVNGYNGEPELDIPAPEVPDECRNARTHEEVLVCERARYQGGMSKQQTADFLYAAVKRLNALGLADGPFGVLVKEGGNNCGSDPAISCDIVCAGNGPAQVQYDVLVGSDAGGAQRAVWERLHGAITVRECRVVR
jgi:hypothetical protein